MSEHVEREKLSALMDEPGSNPDAAAHLEACAACRREFELMRRMRMALSAMGQLEPAEGSWDRIRARLPRVGPIGRWVRGLAGDGWVGASTRAAAAVLVFAGGVALGLRAGGLSPSGIASPAGTPDSGTVAAGGSAGQLADRPGDLAGPDRAHPALPARSGDSPVAERPATTSGRSPSGREAAGLALASTRSGTARASGSVSLPADLPEPYRAVFSRLEALRMQGPTPSEALRDPRAAAQHLARLDALIRASREAVRQMPADPAVNDFLFQVVAERNELDRVLHVASLEYH